MPFCPLPATFLDDLARRPGRVVLELGCGDGGFTGLLREQGIEVLPLDRRPPWRGTVARVVGDATRPPVRAQRFPVVVAANLLRHLWRGFDPRLGPAVWRDLVAPGGVLYVFEDEPASRPPAARNYRDLQALLATAGDLGRGPLLARRQFEAARRRWQWPGRWQGGAAINTWRADAGAVLAMLGGADADPAGGAARLRAAIERDGLNYGSYWWARWSDD